MDISETVIESNLNEKKIKISHLPPVRAEVADPSPPLPQGSLLISKLEFFINGYFHKLKFLISKNR